MAIEFREHPKAGYASRTRENAKCDITIAIAKDFNTAGEICTVNAVKAAKKLYQQIPFETLLTLPVLHSVSTAINGLMGFNYTMNIAGNGIYTFQLNQEYIDTRVYKCLLTIFRDTIRKPITIISGGQTGIDEAGLKAAVLLDIPAICIAPKGWLFRNIKGEDIGDEKLFKERFKDYI